MFDDLQAWILEASWVEVLSTVADVLIVYYVVYRTLLLIRGTKAVQMLFGLLSIIVLFFISKDEWVNLPTLHWVLDRFIGSFILIIVVVFQDDIRRGLSQFGQNPIWSPGAEVREDNEVIEEVVKACGMLSARRLGGLIAIQREARLMQFVTAGVELDANVSKDLLFSIFLPTHQNPLHDGAVIVEGGRIVRAACFLPLTTSPKVDKALGTRHRAAIGLSEQTDAAIVVVSEESGTISLVHGEEIVRGLDSTALREGLQRLLTSRSAAEEGEDRLSLGRLLRRFDRDSQRKPRRGAHTPPPTTRPPGSTTRPPGSKEGPR